MTYMSDDGMSENSSVVGMPQGMYDGNETIPRDSVDFLLLFFFYVTDSWPLFSLESGQLSPEPAMPVGRSFRVSYLRLYIAYCSCCVIQFAGYFVSSFMTYVMLHNGYHP